MNKDAEGGIALAGCIGLVPAVVFGYVIRAWAIVTLWGWFVVPYFHLPPPGYPVALGLSMIASLMTGTSYAGSSEKHDTVLGSMASAYSKILLYPVISVSVGWMIHVWM